MQPQHAVVHDELRAAFPADTIDATGAFDEFGTTYPDAEPYTERLEGKTWPQLDRAYVVTRADALGFLGTRHLVAVLPAYLSALLDDGVWSPAADTLVLLLTRPEPGNKTGVKLPRFEALARALTPAQRTAIAAVLLAFAATDEGGSLGGRARNALDRHWSACLRGRAPTADVQQWTH
jgi:hypothetical protein